MRLAATVRLLVATAAKAATAGGGCATGEAYSLPTGPVARVVSVRALHVGRAVTIVSSWVVTGGEGADGGGGEMEAALG